MTIFFENTTFQNTSRGLSQYIAPEEVYGRLPLHVNLLPKKMTHDYDTYYSPLFWFKCLKSKQASMRWCSRTEYR